MRHGQDSVPSYHFLEHFLRLMFPPGSAAAPSLPYVARPEPAYRALPVSRLSAQASYHVPDAQVAAAVRSDSPAVEVMTDLRRVAAVTIGPTPSVHVANQTMIARGVRALLVVDDQRRICGIVTATDLLGDKPVQIARQRGMRHEEVSVGDIMTPVDGLEAIDMRQVLAARVGDIVATLKRSGRQHALVVDQAPDAAAGGGQMLRGIFSQTQIARQLGTPPDAAQPGRSFAEIAAAISP